MARIELPLLVMAVLLVLPACFTAAPAKETVSKPVQPDSSFDITTDDLSDDDNNNILLYYPVAPKQIDFKTSESSPNGDKLKSSSFTKIERESGSRRPNVMVAASKGDDADNSGSSNVEKMKDIALNSREVRLVGPNQQEVEMKDDLQTKVVVALENLQKEAKEVYGTVNEKLDKGWTELKNSEVWGQMNDKLDKGWTEVKKAEVWGQINDKLDKGWTDLKSMVEGVVNPSSKSG